MIILESEAMFLRQKKNVQLKKKKAEGTCEVAHQVEPRLRTRV